MRNKNAKVSDPNSFVTCPGDEYHVLNEARLNSDGTITLVPGQKESIKDKINSFASTTDLTYVMQRLAVGDTSVLNRDTPIYGDFTNAPKSMAEALQIQIDAKKAFGALPIETKNKFNNSYEAWLMSAGSADWLQKMGIPDQGDAEHEQHKEPSSDVAESSE